MQHQLATPVPRPDTPMQVTVAPLNIIYWENVEATRTESGRSVVKIAAKFADQSLADFKRLMDVNFWGAVYACKAVLPQMKAQGGGVIINVSSIFGKRGMPFETAYCASKFALAGFSEALRAELMSEGVDVCTIFPGAVQTEIFDAAANNTGLELPSYVPKFPADQMAKLIVQTARFPQAEVVAAFDAQAINIAKTVAPVLMDLALGWSVPFIEGMRRGKQTGGQSDKQEGSGNLYKPQDGKKS